VGDGAVLAGAQPTTGPARRALMSFMNDPG
jgi:hypothetical protein